jgi:hypothetical protein
LRMFSIHFTAVIKSLEVIKLILLIFLILLFLLIMPIIANFSNVLVNVITLSQLS